MTNVAHLCQTLYQPHLAPATYCLTVSFSDGSSTCFILLSFFFLCLVQFKALCLRMVTIWMCFCLTSAWTLEPNWHFTLLFLLNLFNSETNSRQKCRCFIGILLQGLNLGGKSSNAWLVFCHRPNKPSKSWLESLWQFGMRCWTFFLFSLKQSAFYVEANVFGFVSVACTVPYVPLLRPRFLRSRPQNA